MPSGACLQSLGCPGASGHSQGNGDHVVGRAVGKGVTSGEGAPRWTHAAW